MLPKIIIVEDHQLFRKSFSILLTSQNIAQIVAEAENGEIFLELIEIHKPDLVLMDISMPVMDGCTASIKALEKYPDLKILVLSMLGDEENYFRMLKAGVSGFILKTTGLEEVRFAINEILNNRTYFSNQLLKNIIKSFQQTKDADNKDDLTEREIEVLKLICDGYSDIDIAEKLFLSPQTVNKHRANILSKTGVKNSVSLVVYAIKNKIITLEKN